MATQVSNYWKDCIFRESENNLLYCSEAELIYPPGVFRTWFSEITSVKAGRTIEGYQEYLINENKIFKVKGGSNWEVVFLSTLEKRQKNEEEFGKQMLNRARLANVPWHIAKLTKRIDSDTEAITLLRKIRVIAKDKKKKITNEQVYALRSVDLELRMVTLKMILGEEIFLKLEKTLIKNEKLCRLLAYYLAFKGKVNKKDIDKQCKIPAPVSIGYFEEFEHNQRLRIVLADIHRDLVGITDNIESNEEAIELLKKVKYIAATSNISIEDSSALKSNNAEVRDSVLKKILGNEIWEKIKDQISSNLDLAYFLGYYLRTKGKVKN